MNIENIELLIKEIKGFIAREEAMRLYELAREASLIGPAWRSEATAERPPLTSAWVAEKMGAYSSLLTTTGDRRTAAGRRILRPGSTG